MGFDRHAIRFLRHASVKQPLGEVATMGRQGLSLSQSDLQNLLGPDAAFDEFCEPVLIRNLGASLVESFDYSSFEGATHLIDLNRPAEIERQYDTIIDAGTLEHIFNAPEALRTFAKLCKVGGQVIHISPSNNFCNHGFWQLSPELFFSLYSEANGFADTEVFMADVGEKGFWYKLNPPRNGRWSDTTSPRALYSLVRTRKVRDVPAFSVQQAGYAVSWEEPQLAPSPWNDRRERFKRAVEGTPLFDLFRFALRIIRHPDHALRGNPNFTKHPI
jgi:hypothetical protein